MPVSAKVVCDSTFGATRLITLEIELHRFVLPEFNTHRTISRNFQSSRAVPIKQMIEQVKNDPAMPVHFGKNQPGMQADEEGVDWIDFFQYHADMWEASLSKEDAWRMAARSAAMIAQSFAEAGYHKQLVNRLIEPFTWTKGVVTATEDHWNAFLKLRAHKDAQPEIQALAFKIRDAISQSTPKGLKEGEWHLPYVDKSQFDLSKYMSVGEWLHDMIKVATSCCAQVSYRRLDDSLEKAKKVYDMLNLPEKGIEKEDPPHMSPCEHVAKAGYFKKDMSGNFTTTDFLQYRKALESGIEKDVI